MHVRTMDINIIQHPKLRKSISQGLNHIPLKPTHPLGLCIATVLDAFQQLAHLLQLEALSFPMLEAQEWLKSTCLLRLKESARKNLYGFRVSQEDVLSIPTVKDEILWLTQHLFCSGLDKATNNCCFICIRHLRLMALERLSGPDFHPCKDGNVWLLRSHILEKVCNDLKNLLPELQINFEALPYLMATYKQHKGKYRWLTNAFQTTYSGIAHLLTITTMLILDSVKHWAAEKARTYATFFQVKTSLFWLVNSVVEVALNMPDNLSNIYVADITRCYESIPLQGMDNLPQTISKLIKIGFKQQKALHPRSNSLIWVRVDSEGNAARAIWATQAPKYGSWFSISESRLIELHTWLMCNCYINLGDRVWQQVAGIPMGFACSPLWCNMYLLYYESQFILRLAKLGRKDILGKFQHAYRYIDDLCWFNVDDAESFLSPAQERSSDNPYWIYPLHVLEIKSEISRFSEDNPRRGLEAHFMNLNVSIYGHTESTPNYLLCKFDKRRELPFSFTQYIVFNSNRPVKQSYAVVVS